MTTARFGRNAWRRRLLQLAGAGALAPILGVRQLLAMSRPVEQGLNRIQGEVRLNGRLATEGQLVGPGDRLSTGRDASAVLVINADAFLLRADTEVEFNGRDLVVEALRMLSGRLLSVFEPGRGERRMATGVATLGIRGTGLYVEADATRSYVCTCYGVVDIVPDGAPEQAERVETRHHESPRYIWAGDAAQPITVAPVINHVDAELFMLESLVRREPPFNPGAY